MSGWEKVIAATVLAVIGLAACNLAIWRRVRAMMRNEEASAEVEKCDQRLLK